MLMVSVSVFDRTLKSQHAGSPTSVICSDYEDVTRWR